MLKIRLARHGRKNLPFYRIVLTEHTRPAQSGYKLVLGWFNPSSHTMEVDVEQVKSWLSKGAQLSERVAKLLYANTKDAVFKKYFIERDSKKGMEIHNKKVADAKAAAEEAKAAQEAETPAPEESKVEAEQTVVDEKNEPAE